MAITLKLNMPVLGWYRTYPPVGKGAGADRRQQYSAAGYQQRCVYPATP